MAVKRQVDISCMFCGNTPCTCEGVAKKKAAPKRQSATPAPKPVTVPVQQEQTPPAKRASLQSMIGQPPVEKYDDEERTALTVLFQGGFMLEPVGDKRGFEAVRPMLNMSPVDIDIALWKMKRSQCQAKQK